MTRKHTKTKAKTSYNFLRELLQDQLEILVQQNQVALGIGIINEQTSSSSNSNNNLPMTPPMIPTEAPIIDSGENLLSDSMVSILPINMESSQDNYTPPPTPFMGDSLKLILAPVMEKGSNEGANGGIIIDDSQNNGELILPPVSDGAEQDQNASAGDNSGDMMTTLPVNDTAEFIVDNSASDNSGQNNSVIFPGDDQEEGTEMQEIKKGDNLNLNEGDDVQDDSSNHSDDTMASILPIDMGNPVDNSTHTDNTQEVAKEEEKPTIIVPDEVILENSGAVLEATKEKLVVIDKPGSLPTFPSQFYLYSKGISNSNVKGLELSEAELKSRESEDNTDLGLVKDRMAQMYSIFGGKVGDIVTDNSYLLGSDDNAEE